MLHLETHSSTRRCLTGYVCITAQHLGQEAFEKCRGASTVLPKRARSDGVLAIESGRGMQRC